jgi:hypothetical protein
MADTTRLPSGTLLTGLNPATDVAPVGTLIESGGVFYRSNNATSPDWTPIVAASGGTFALSFTVPNEGESVTQTLPQDGTWFLANALIGTGAADAGVLIYNDTKAPGSVAIRFNFATSNTTEIAGGPTSANLTAVTREWDAGDSIRLLYDEGLNLTGTVHILFVPR